MKAIRLNTNEQNVQLFSLILRKIKCREKYKLGIIINIGFALFYYFI